MPLYEYQCSQCGRRTEKRQKFADAALTDCPFCGGPLKKLISAPAIQFKGGGWFADGYGNAKSGSSNAAAEGGSSNTASGDSSPAKSDAKSSGSGESSSSAKSTGDSSSGSTASSSAASSTSGASSSSASSSDK